MTTIQEHSDDGWRCRFGRHARGWRSAALLLSTVACATVLPQSGTGHTPVPSVPPTSAPTSGVADEVFTRTNAARRSAGLPALMRSANLMAAARIQADQMAQTNTLSHDLPGTRYPTLSSRLQAVSYPLGAAGENIAEGQMSATEALDAWMHSSGHRANILSTTYTELGTGVATALNGTWYFAQVFGRPR